MLQNDKKEVTLNVKIKKGFIWEDTLDILE